MSCCRRWVSCDLTLVSTCCVSTSRRVSTFFQIRGRFTTIFHPTAPSSSAVYRQPSRGPAAFAVPRRRRPSAARRTCPDSSPLHRPTCPSRSDLAGSGSRAASVRLTWMATDGDCRNMETTCRLSIVTTSSKDVTVHLLTYLCFVP